jgi:diaminopimelate decarboxylase
MNGFPNSRFGITENEIGELKDNLPENCKLEMLHCHYCDGFRTVESFRKRILALNKRRIKHLPEI